MKKQLLRLTTLTLCSILIFAGCKKTTISITAKLLATFQLFSFNAATGTLTSEKQLDKYVRENGGPTTVSFSEDGTKLAVSTWGIAHFSTENTSLSEQHPSRVYVYSFSNGNISNRRFFEEAGISGTIGFSWAKASNNKLFVSNFNLIPTKRDNSVTVLTDNSTTVTKSANYSVTTASGINEACWTALNSTGDKLYVASFATNLISTFNATSSGLSFSSSETRGGTAPAGDSKDIYVTPDDRYLYNLGAFQSFSINGFAITGNSVNYKSQTFLATTASGAGTPGKYNFLGLMGFDVKEKEKLMPKGYDCRTTDGKMTNMDTNKSTRQ